MLRKQRNILLTIAQWRQLQRDHIEPVEKIFAEASLRHGLLQVDVRRSDDPATLSVPLRPLSTGVYKVTWHATSVDTHKTEGSYTFTVGP